jgi:hypothetical protein
MVQSSWALLLLWFAFAYCPYTCDSSPIPIGISGLRIYVPVSVVTFFVIAFSIVASITYFFEALVKQDVYKEYTYPPAPEPTLPGHVRRPKIEIAPDSKFFPWIRKLRDKKITIRYYEATSYLYPLVFNIIGWFFAGYKAWTCSCHVWV